SPGVVIGKVFFLDKEEFQIKKRRIRKDMVPKNISRFREALAKTEKEIKEIRTQVTKKLGKEEAYIFDAHLLILKDPYLIKKVTQKVEEELINVEHSFFQVLETFRESFASMEDSYLKGRAVDIKDVGRRVLKNLLGKERETLATLREEVIVVAHDLSPSDTVSMHKEKVIGFATDMGTKTSHTAIMARALEIPAVVGLKNITQKAQALDALIVDGSHGSVIINPNKETLKRYRKDKESLEVLEHELLELKNLPAQTLDGHRITLAANIEVPEEIEYVKEHGGEGIGLYRTEFLYLGRDDLPSVDEQFKAYREAAQKLAPHPVIIRTLDLGGDKFLSYLNLAPEMNPFLGLRAIRLCLADIPLFKDQLRAILKASTYGNLKIMYPMISGVEEVKKANQILTEVEEEFKKKKIPFNEKLEVGAMIEIPSAALTCESIAKEVDFFSIGTNDLIQYSLAIDRVNENIAYLYQPLHPAVLHILKRIIDGAHQAGIWVGMCGEMAGEPLFVLILLGLGLDELSMSPLVIPEVKKIIRSLALREAKELTRKALKLSTAQEIEALLKEKVKKILPEVVT
ncbi:phosphoenolpyruvate--protein phosphotransferase, partial [bacterium]|nr:phosphoenolpyruvate--protein phosphotransferase [bacterium]